MKISTRQNRLLHVAKRKLGLTEDMYRTALVNVAGVTSATELDQAGFDAVMALFEHCGFKPMEKTGPNYGARPGMASFAQLEFIRSLWAEYCVFRSWFDDDRKTMDAALDTWLSNHSKVSSLRFVTGPHAAKIITALKSMCSDKRKAA